MIKRTDYRSDASGYFDALDANLRDTALAVRKLVLSATPGIEECIKWGMPVYEKGALICAIRRTKTYVALQFHYGDVELHDPQHLLEGTGATMRHVKIRSASEIKPSIFSDWIRQIASKV